ncbi:MAG: hypothetical protein HY077_01035 [Elusimicrobia bacterium]|nr:hypothetical protein [Elusimicrobiota bacterium]
MTGKLLAALLLSARCASAADAPRPVQMINLSCVEALITIDQQGLAGVFSFIAEKDEPAAFADLIVRSHKALKKFVAKVEKDKKLASGISAWDRDALQFALGIYDSPLGATLENPGDKLKARIKELAAGPVVTLEQIAAARRKG